ncbi:MAG: YihY/virulence factor BrkB family protein [Glaciihabitans sp.]|nr:YihY/virulence factor BrkB family protein [Glaciihabitans sp.]
MAEEAGDRAKTAPDPEDPRKPDSITELDKPSWMYILRKTLREFGSDQCTDLAASLTYFAVLAVFPALLAFVSILGLVGDAEKTTTALLNFGSGLLPDDILTSLEGPIKTLTESPAAGLTLITGILGALWSASGYVGAFGRAMNRIYGITEGRPVWKLRPVTLLVTIVAVIAAVLAAVLLVLSGPVAENIGAIVGLGDGAVFVWNIVKWPVLAVIAILVVAVLYYATPNVQQPKFRWMSLGALVALLVLLLASVAFAFYVANFSSYNATYGSIGGVIVALLWLWIANNALLFGAELDAEIERGRQLQAGIAAEETIQLPPRDTRQSDKKAEQRAKDVRVGRTLRRKNEKSGEKRAAADKQENDKRDDDKREDSKQDVDAT